MKYTDIAPLVAFDVMGAPAPRVAYAVAQAAHEFFRFTRTYKVEMDPAKLPANVSEFDLEIPTNTLLLEVSKVTYGGRPVDGRTPAQLSGDWESRTGDPDQYLVQGDTLRLIPYPVEKKPTLLSVTFTVTPLLTATEIPDDIGQRFQEALINGAKYFALIDVNKPWTNPNAAAVFRSEYMATVNEQRILERKGGVRDASLQVKMRRL